MEIDISKGLFFNDGCVVRKNVVVIAAGFNDAPDGKCSRVLFVLDGKWRHFDVPTDMIISVTAACDIGYVVGIGGLVIEVPLTPTATLESVDNAGMWEIEDTQEYGQLTRIRAIGDQPYCCGQSGQIYRLDGNKWIRADLGLRTDKAPDFEDVDGSSPTDYYAVGIGGAMYHFNGRKWKAIHLPTNLHLSNIRCVTPELYYVCGNDGLILKGSRDQWAIVAEPEPGKNYWGLELFEEAAFLAHGNGIDRFAQTNLVPVKFDVKGKITFHRLHAHDGQLWSFGVDHIMKYDQLKWTIVRVPVRN